MGKNQDSFCTLLLTYFFNLYINLQKAKIITMKRFLAALPLILAPGALPAHEAVPADTRPEVFLVADAHLDTQWNWDIQTTIREYVWNTVNQNLALLDKYPNYVFNFEGGVKYAWIKEYFPREYELLKKQIAAGRWHIAGASWDATDAIVPSIESAIRNVMLGQTFYRREFGTESTDIFLPDCFGFGYTLPTVAAHCGLIGFSSQKLGWRNNDFHGEGRKYPFNVGVWRGIDGAEIMMAHGYSYGQRWKNEDLTRNERLGKLASENSLNRFFHYYGTGDIGGSPTITSVDAVNRAVGADGPLRIISCASDSIFKAYLPYSAHPELPRYEGELLMDVHGTGCYTSQAAMKLYNRQNELLGDAAERAAVAASMIGAAEYPSEALTTAWQRFIFHQFHDDLTGTSIPRAYEFSWNDELLSLKQFGDILTHSVGAVASRLDTRVKGTPVVLYNPLGHEATDVVELTVPVKGRPGKVSATDHNGRPAAAQLLGVADGKATVLVEATVPPVGFAVYGLSFSGSASSTAHTPASSLENSVYRLSLDSKGDIVSLVDKRSSRELVKNGKAIRLAMFTENESHSWPAWEIMKSTLDAEPVSVAENVSIQLIEKGPLRSTLLVEKSHGDSKLRQYIRLYEGALAHRIDFFNEADWASANSLLKAEFPLTTASAQATYDLGVGSVKRGNNVANAYEVYSQRWTDLTDGDYGVTIMNDCKYGWDKPDDSTLRLTLLHTPKSDRNYKHQNDMDHGHHTFTYSIVAHQGALDTSLADRLADGLNQRIKAFSTAKHPGSLGKSFSAAALSGDGLAIKALKKAEASDEYVARVYETAGKGTEGSIAFASPVVAASKADGTEKTIGKASFAGASLNVGAGRNGIATYKFRVAPASASPAGRYATLPLAYDKKCFSWNQFNGDADFSGGHSYAAELVPTSLTASGVPFALENKALLNGKMCKNDTIALPEGNYSRLYILAAAATEQGNARGTFRAGKNAVELTVPSYTGFIGQWGHTGQSVGYMLPDEVAFAGTHRHSAAGDHPYEFTYMYKYAIDIPAGAREIVLPDNPSLVIFSATLAADEAPAVEPLAPLFRTSIVGDHQAAEIAQASRKSILKPEHLVAWSGHCNDKEHPRFLTDGDSSTKWCDVGALPSFVEYDLGDRHSITGWALTNAGQENRSYVTTSCLLQGRNDKSEDWKTLDILSANRTNEITRTLDTPAEARYLRLLVVQPEQGAGGATRIYELAVY